MTLLLDTRVVHWWSIDASERFSPTAQAAMSKQMSSLFRRSHGSSWHGWRTTAALWCTSPPTSVRVVRVPIRGWLDALARQVRTIGITPAIADIDAALPPTFPADPADRLTYATAVEHGIPLVTKDERLRAHAFPVNVTLW